MEKDVNNPGVEPSPSMFVFGRILCGFDKDAVDAMLAWRKRPS